MIETSDLKNIIITAVIFGALATVWHFAFYYVPVDVEQGSSYRIIYLHVPSSFASFFCATMLFGVSLFSLRSKTDRFLIWSKAFVEVGLIFIIIALVSGAIWGKATWGTWWTWDARLTTTLLLFLLLAAFLLLYSSQQPGGGRRKSCAVLGILIFVDVPIIYFSVSWWRTLHQPASLFKAGGPSINAEMLAFLAASIVLSLSLAVWLSVLRAALLFKKDELESATFAQVE